MAARQRGSEEGPLRTPEAPSGLKVRVWSELGRIPNGEATKSADDTDRPHAAAEVFVICHLAAFTKELLSELVKEAGGIHPYNKISSGLP